MVVVAAFVAPFLLQATARFVATAAQLPEVRLAVITTSPADRCRRSCAAPGRALAGGRRAGPAADRRGGGRAVPAAGPVRAAGRRARAAAGAAGPGPRGARHRGHGRRDRAQRARQVADEDGAAARPACRAPGTGWSPTPDAALAFADEVGFPLVAKPPAGRRRAGHVPARRRRRAAQLAGAAAAAGRRPRPAGGVPRRRGAHLRQRHHRRADRVGVDRGLPAAAAGGAAQPVDPVDGAAAPRAVDDPRYAAITEVGPAALRALGVQDALTPHGVVPPAGRLGRGLRGGRPAAGRADHLDARLRARRRLLSRVGGAGDPRPVRPAGAHASPPAPPTCAGRAAAGCARCTGSRRCSAGSGTWSSRPSCRSPASRRRRATRARAT